MGGVQGVGGVKGMGGAKGVAKAKGVGEARGVGGAKRVGGVGRIKIGGWGYMYPSRGCGGNGRRFHRAWRRRRRWTGLNHFGASEPRSVGWFDKKAW
eukprot:6185592-Pleurochrysis_carterae.AAC.1